ncbi:MAG TPA: hypothetical protein PK357_02450 [Candidatus Pacearchaeota archaeon]|nr:hypothetical protein [Candidatus Pacearchaeota archaeon]
MSEWISESKCYFLNADIFYKDGKKWNLSNPIQLNKGEIQEIGASFFEKPISKIETKLDEVEPLTIRLNIQEGNYIITQLNLGIRNSTNISYIGEHYHANRKGSTDDSERFFFNNEHEPSGFDSPGFGVGGGWPELKSPFIIEDIKFYLNNLSKFRPEISNNLKKCISLLEEHFKNPITK